MHLKTILLLLLSCTALLLLASCSAGGAVAPTLPANASPTPTLLPATATASIAGCSAINTIPTPEAGSSSFPAVTAADFTRGPSDAPVTMIEYCDFQTPICLSMAAVASNLVYKHPRDLQFVFRPIPISSLDKSQMSVDAALAADDQGHFWEMYDVLFQKNSEWANLSQTDFESWLTRQESGIGLDASKFSAELNSPDTTNKANSLFEAAHSAGLQAVPLVLLNGKPQPLFALDFNTLDSTISLIALGARQFKSCPAFNIDASKQYIATIHTEKGDIVIQLFPDKAPLAVNSFVFLAQNGWYNGVTFHRVIPGFVAQAGDPSGTGNGGPGYVFNDETNAGLQFDKPGVVGMANSGPNTNGSQFFITYTPQPSLNGRYTIFGQVLQGMDVVESLTPRDASQNPGAAPGDKITSVTIEVK